MGVMGQHVTIVGNQCQSAVQIALLFFHNVVSSFSSTFPVYVHSLASAELRDARFAVELVHLSRKVMTQHAASNHKEQGRTSCRVSVRTT